MSEGIRATALMGNYKRATKCEHPNLSFIMTENVGVWYFLVDKLKGDNDEFTNGQFIGRVIATEKYPYEPPDVEMLTPNGVFPVNDKNFCVDIGRYHRKDYPATYGMDGFVKMILSGLIGWADIGPGIALIETKLSKKKRIENIKKKSIDSKEYNKKYNTEILKLFSDSLEDKMENMQL